MTITGHDGKQYDVTGSGQGIYNTIGASAGLLSLLGGNNGNGILGGLFGGRNNGCSEDQPVTRYDAAQQIALAAKDAEIANLKADQSTDKKLVEVYTALASQDNRQRDRIEALDKELSAKITSERESRLISEKEQAVFNQTMIGTTSTMASQIKQLNTIVDEITTNVVPANKVCQTGCCCND